MAKEKAILAGVHISVGIDGGNLVSCESFAKLGDEVDCIGGIITVTKNVTHVLEYHKLVIEVAELKTAMEDLLEQLRGEIYNEDRDRG